MSEVFAYPSVGNRELPPMKFHPLDQARLESARGWIALLANQLPKHNVIRKAASQWLIDTDPYLDGLTP